MNMRISKISACTLVVASLSGLGCDSDTSKSAENVQSATVENTPAKPTLQSEVVASEPYVGGTRLRVLVKDRSASREQLGKLAVYLAAESGTEGEVQVVTYFHPDQTSGTFTLSNTVWKKAGEFEHQFTRHAGQIVEGAPTDEERTTHRRMKAFRKSSGLEGTDEALAKELAKANGGDAVQLLEAHQKVALYDMP